MSVSLSSVGAVMPQPSGSGSSAPSVTPDLYSLGSVVSAVYDGPGFSMVAPQTAVTPAAAPATHTTAVAGVSGGGVTGSGTEGQAQAAGGAQAVTKEQIASVLQQVISAITQLMNALQAQISGGGAAGAPGSSCGMEGCAHTGGAAGAPVAGGGASAAPQSQQPAAQAVAHSHGTDAGSGAQALSAPAGFGAASEGGGGSAGTVAPSSVKDKTSTAGLTAASRRGLEEAHKFGIPLVSGKRSGGMKTSDHRHGNAIDVSTLAIGSAKSTEGTAAMKAYADHMRAEGKAGRLNVKYVISDGRIASAGSNWEWREYTYPGKTRADLAALKASNRGEYNRIQHYDHVHVSFK